MQIRQYLLVLPSSEVLHFCNSASESHMSSNCFNRGNKMLDQVSAHLFDIQTFWVAPGSAQVEKLPPVNLVFQVAHTFFFYCLFIIV